MPTQVFYLRKPTRSVKRSLDLSKALPGARVGKNVVPFSSKLDDNLTTAEWKKLRAYAKEKVDYFADSALKEFRSRMEITGKK